MPISYEVLFCDLFEQMVKPESRNDGTYYPRNKNPQDSSVDIFVNQAMSVERAQGITAQVEAAWRVAMDMKGLQGAARAAKAVICPEVQRAVDPRGSKSFADAVAQIAAATKKAGEGEQLSAASKMVQVFPEFRDDAVIYDSVVRRALGPKDVHQYVTEFELQMHKPHISRGNGPDLTILEFFQDAQVQDALERKKVRPDLHRFIVRRSFDRALWLAQGGKDQWGTRVFGLC